MQDYSEPRQKKNSRARERIDRRRQRREAMVSLRDDSLGKVKNTLPEGAESAATTASRFISELIWYLRHKTPAIKLMALLPVIIVVLFFGSMMMSSAIAPNIWALNQNLSGMNVEDAASVIETAWEDKTIQVLKGTELIDTVTPQQLGLTIDAQTMAEEAKAAGLSGIPFGVEIEPTFLTNFGSAQNYLLTIVEDVYVPPYDAGYRWDDGQVVGVPGRNSEELDINATIDAIFMNPLSVYRNGRVQVSVRTTPPDMLDPSPWLEDAQRYVAGGVTLTGYDPFKDRFHQWTSTPDEITRWLEAGASGLTLREEAFTRFIRELNEMLNAEDQPRYLDLEEVSEDMSEAIASKSNEVLLRVRYLPTEYTILSGDSGHNIGRRKGLPFRLIDVANSNINWNALSIGDVITLPSRDQVVPLDPVPEKRIVVDLDAMWLVAYENGEMIYNWPISIGMPSAPTSPGIFQILDKTPKAYGSSFNMCGASGCSQWEMDWFMSIYEVAPGLTNGFHGAVLLPNGAYLGGGSTQQRSTYGCVMSENGNAERLYNWADLGTMVEMISSQFPPESQLGQEAYAFIQQVSAIRDHHAGVLENLPGTELPGM